MIRIEFDLKTGVRKEISLTPEEIALQEAKALLTASRPIVPSLEERITILENKVK